MEFKCQLWHKMVSSDLFISMFLFFYLHFRIIIKYWDYLKNEMEETFLYAITITCWQHYDSWYNFFKLNSEEEKIQLRNEATAKKKGKNPKWSSRQDPQSQQWWSLLSHENVLCYAILISADGRMDVRT